MSSLCLLEYHMTPIRHQGTESSPMKLMQQRTIRGILPTRQCNRFEITFVSEKHVGEDDVLFTNHLAGK